MWLKLVFTLQWLQKATPISFISFKMAASFLIFYLDNIASVVSHDYQGLYWDVKTSSNTKQIEYYDVSLNQFSTASHSHRAV